MGFLRKNILAGILVVAPVALTLYVVVMLLGWIDAAVGALLPQQYQQQFDLGTSINPSCVIPMKGESMKINTIDPPFRRDDSVNRGAHLFYHIPGMGLLIALVFLVIIGAIARSVLGQVLVRMGESILSHIPIMRGLYGAFKQIFQTMLTNTSEAFRKVVLVEFPRRDAWTLGFVTGTTVGEAEEKLKQTTVNVFVPTTPNPTSGFLLMVPQTDLVPLDMTVEQGIKMVVSGGIITPPMKKPEPIPAEGSV
ncbi:MAG: DUF502 domain-containing protein [Alphaproteobacteria bacterium]